MSATLEAKSFKIVHEYTYFVKWCTFRVHFFWGWNARRWCFAGDDWALPLSQKGFLSQFFTSFKT